MKWSGDEQRLFIIYLKNEVSPETLLKSTGFYHGMDEYGSPEEIFINSTLIIIFLTYITDT